MVEGLAIPAIDVVDVNNITASEPVALVEALARVMQPDLDDRPVTPGTADRTLTNNARTLTDNLSYVTVLDNLNYDLARKIMTTEDVRRISTDMVRSAGHLFYEAQSRGSQAEDDPTTYDDVLSPEEREDGERQMKEERDEMKRAVVARGRRILNDMADRLRRELTPGGPAIRIDTDSLCLQVQKIRGKDLADDRLNDTGVNIAFPPAEKLFKGFEPMYIDVKVICYHDNPFTWGNNSNIINSGVYDISLIPLTMSPGEITDTEEDILISIATNGTSGDYSSSGLVHEVDSTGNGSVVHHAFNISDVDDAFVVQVTALNRSSRISVFGRGGGLAHSKNCEVCLIWQDWKPTASHLGAPESRSVMFFVSGKNHTGKYSVGVEVAGVDDVYQDAVDDGVLLVDPDDQSGLSLNGTQFYSLKVLRLSCRYWAEDTESWLSNGCTVRFDVE
ncbi:uncharacterized protein LOC118409186 [Branchiostoma floridae]|uniref:Uncharacterized protein LOC118409186 n=1 Tax=Branchiostoma floridae TaxID=7739 RepID=A0A9J7KLD6_BRAFL|nr:uncharacterized protein LOC118409186 [Branchiostoma floridae]